MNPKGIHVILDLWFTKQFKEILNDLLFLESLLTDAAVLANSTILNTFVHKFDPEGVSINITIAESHITIHTWPSELYASIDIYTCGNKTFPIKAADLIIEKLKPHTINRINIHRGNIEGITINIGQKG